MTRLFDKSLVLVTGKGGVGKSTVAAALGRALAREGRRVMVCEVSTQTRMPALLGSARTGSGTAEDGLGIEHEVEPGVWTVSVDPDAALRAWLANQLGSKSLVSILTRSNLFQYFVAAAPGARELVTITRVWEMAQAQRWDKKARGYDVVVADLPASGHALGMLRAPRTFTDIARIGPIASQAGKVAASLEDPAQVAIVAVTLPGELPVSETLELEGRTHAALGRGIDLIVANDVLTHRWTGPEVAGLAEHGVNGRLANAAAREAARSAMQQRQLRRLRAGAGVPVVTLGHVGGVVDADAVRELSDTLAARLAKLG